jgi:hypothetical protein
MKGLIKWQRQWNSTEKGALCRSFFPAVEQRLKMKVPITPEFTATVTGHWFKIAVNLMCPCNEGTQTSEEIIYVRKILESQISSLIQDITARRGDWPPTNGELVANYLNAFSRFIKSIEFQKLNWTIYAHDPKETRHPVVLTVTYSELSYYRVTYSTV